MRDFLDKLVRETWWLMGMPLRAALAALMSLALVVTAAWLFLIYGREAEDLMDEIEGLLAYAWKWAVVLPEGLKNP
jgi:hypothetical protein